MKTTGISWATFFCRYCNNGSHRDQQIDLLNQQSNSVFQHFRLRRDEAGNECKGLVKPVPEIDQSLLECPRNMPPRAGSPAVHLADAPYLPNWSRPRPERPRRRAAECRDELAPLHVEPRRKRLAIAKPNTLRPAARDEMADNWRQILIRSDFR